MTKQAQNDGTTPLYHAANKDHDDITKVLMYVCRTSLSANHFAWQMLTEAGATVDPITNPHVTILFPVLAPLNQALPRCKLCWKTSCLQTNSASCRHHHARKSSQRLHWLSSLSRHRDVCWRWSSGA